MAVTVIRSDALLQDCATPSRIFSALRTAAKELLHFVCLEYAQMLDVDDRLEAAANRLHIGTHALDEAPVDEKLDKRHNEYVPLANVRSHLNKLAIVVS